MSKMTRTKYMYHSKTPYSSTQKGIKEGHIPIYLIDGELLIESDEADEYHRKRKEARLRPFQDLFA
jgi:hypothetical protein